MGGCSPSISGITLPNSLPRFKQQGRISNATTFPLKIIFTKIQLQTEKEIWQRGSQQARISLNADQEQRKPHTSLPYQLKQSAYERKQQAWEIILMPNQSTCENLRWKFDQNIERMISVKNGETDLMKNQPIEDEKDMRLCFYENKEKKILKRVLQQEPNEWRFENKSKELKRNYPRGWQCPECQHQTMKDGLCNVKCKLLSKYGGVFRK